MRLDHYLVHHHDLTRSRAQLLILDGAVSVNGVIVKKVSKTIAPHDTVHLEDTIKYVSRAGLKLEHALDIFSVDPRGFSCLDIGSSTGGFTDCLLQRGATHVDAVDVGTGQLVEHLRHDPRVTSYEQTDIRVFQNTHPYDLIVCDASFISLTKIIPTLSRFLKEGTRGIFLIKPQFEVGKGFLNKQGLVTDPQKNDEVIALIKKTLNDFGYIVQGEVIPSPLLGGDGNREFIISFVFSR